jgi:hypothetical protein
MRRQAEPCHLLCARYSIPLVGLRRSLARACLHSPCPEDGGDEIDDGGEALVGLLVARGNASKGFYAADADSGECGQSFRSIADSVPVIADSGSRRRLQGLTRRCRCQAFHASPPCPPALVPSFGSIGTILLLSNRHPERKHFLSC